MRVNMYKDEAITIKFKEDNSIFSNTVQYSFVKMLST